MFFHFDSKLVMTAILKFLQIKLLQINFVLTIKGFNYNFNMVTCGHLAR